jgi:DNA-binding GntR family transcriptional regulator
MANDATDPQAHLPLYERLRTAILNGHYRSSTALVETALANEYGVSRTPVREALRRLEQDGMLQRVGRQLVVRVTTPEEVLEIYDCRIVLEGMAAEWAARQRTDYDLALLESAQESMAQHVGRSPAEMAAINHVFHVRLWRASHNSTLHDLLERLEVHIRRYPEPTVSRPGRWEAAVAEHAGILQAIRDRDADLARSLSSAHMAAARDLRLKMIQLSERS